MASSHKEAMVDILAHNMLAVMVMVVCSCVPVWQATWSSNFLEPRSFLVAFAVCLNARAKPQVWGREPMRAGLWGLVPPARLGLSGHQKLMSCTYMEGTS